MVEIELLYALGNQKHSCDSLCCNIYFMVVVWSNPQYLRGLPVFVGNSYLVSATRVPIPYKHN